MPDHEALALLPFTHPSSAILTPESQSAWAGGMAALDPDEEKEADDHARAVGELEKRVAISLKNSAEPAFGWLGDDEIDDF